MNKPIGIKCADIYLRFPEIMEEEANDLADFLENEHIVYEGATDVFMEKDKELKDYKLRCEKAIELIKSTYFYGMRSGKTLLQKYLYDLLNILNGSDEECTKH